VTSMNWAARTLTIATAIWLSSTIVDTQTVIKLPKNKYTPEQDVKLGLEAANEVRQQYPIIKDEKIQTYLSGLGDRLVAVAPAELRNPAYQFSFTPVNLKEINAFALPGGPMFVHRGMFDAAASEGEVVGVMAHELSHVLLRHGTANASKASNPWLAIGQLAGQIGGAVVGGPYGGYIAQGAEFGLGTLMLRYSRDFEKQADLMGSQLMAKAGYDPRSLAHMFETIEKDGGGGNPQWLSDHPNPGNRVQYITKEAESLTIASGTDTTQFQPMKTQFASLPPAKSMADLAKAKGGGNGGNGGNAGHLNSAGGDSGGGGNAGGAPAVESVGTPGQPVPRPTTQYRDIAGGKIFQASVPADWTPIPSKASIKVIPQNGYGNMNGQTVFNYGVEFGIAQANSRDLQEATNTWLNAIGQANPDLKLGGEQQMMKISQRSAIGTPLVNPSALGGQERISVYTTFLSNGALFYYLTVVPEQDAQAFSETFRHIGQSIRLTDARQ